MAGEDDTAVYHRQHLRRTLVFQNNRWVPARTVPGGEAGGLPGGGEASAVLAQETGGAVALAVGGQECMEC